VGERIRVHRYYHRELAAFAARDASDPPGVVEAQGMFIAWKVPAKPWKFTVGAVRAGLLDAVSSKGLTKNQQSDVRLQKQRLRQLLDMAEPVQRGSEPPPREPRPPRPQPRGLPFAYPLCSCVVEIPIARYDAHPALRDPPVGAWSTPSPKGPARLEATPRQLPALVAVAREHGWAHEITVRPTGPTPDQVRDSILERAVTATLEQLQDLRNEITAEVRNHILTERQARDLLHIVDVNAEILAQSSAEPPPGPPEKKASKKRARPAKTQAEPPPAPPPAPEASPKACDVPASPLLTPDDVARSYSARIAAATSGEVLRRILEDLHPEKLGPLYLAELGDQLKARRKELPPRRAHIPIVPEEPPPRVVHIHLGVRSVEIRCEGADSDARGIVHDLLEAGWLRAGDPYEGGAEKTTVTPRPRAAITEARIHPAKGTRPRVVADAVWTAAQQLAGVRLERSGYGVDGKAWAGEGGGRG
jgi:hypothetical protein